MAGDATYQQEFLISVRDEMLPLIEEDWREIEHNKDFLPLAPDWDAYYALEEQGLFQLFTARLDGELIGYFTVVKFPSLHSKGKILAANDVIYLCKEHRRGRIGRDLFKFVEGCLKQDGHEVLYVTTSEAHPLDDFMSHLGYKKIESKFEKVL